MSTIEAHDEGSDDNNLTQRGRKETPVDPEKYCCNRFSFRRLWTFTGPGFLASIALLDPGNIESDIRAGTLAGYKFLWMLLLSTILIYVIQKLAIRVGVVTGQPLAVICSRIYPKLPNCVLWFLIQSSVIGSNIQQIIGTAFAIHFLSSEKISLQIGILITCLDTYSVIFLEFAAGLRNLEYIFFAAIIGMISTFGYDFGRAKPDGLSIMKGIFSPWYFQNPFEGLFSQTMDIVGSCFIAHNLYLHSYLVTTRPVDRKRTGEIKIACLYYVIEAAVAFFLSFIGNLLIMSIFAKGLYMKKNYQIHEMCQANMSKHFNDRFPMNNNSVDANMFKAGEFIECAYGQYAFFALVSGIFIAGQASTITGAYSSQLIMEGFLNLKWKFWKRVLFTRSIALLPTFLFTLLGNRSFLSMINHTINDFMLIFFPFALIPALTITNSKDLMKDKNFVNGRCMKWFLTTISVCIFVNNIYYIGKLLSEKIPHEWYLYIVIAICIIPYTAFILYLFLVQFAYDGYKLPQEIIRMPELLAEELIPILPTQDINQGDGSIEDSQSLYA